MTTVESHQGIMSDSTVTIDHATLNALMHRRSLRRYLTEPINDDVIQGVLSAAHRAPSAHNRQPWRFCVVRSDEQKDRLARAMGARLQADLQADHVPTAVISADVNRSYARLTQAPVLIIVCMTMIDMDTYTDDQRNHNEWVMAVQSVAMAGQNLMIAAHAYGLGSCWMCAPLFCQDVVQHALDLPDDWQPQGIITLGYPAQQREKSRKPLETRVLWR